MAINLTRVERQILYNQNKIFSLLDKENSNEYEFNMDVLYKGFEREYESVIDVYPDEEVTTHEICEETVNILSMYRSIENSFARLSEEDKVEIDLKPIKFEGFDANNDPHYYYAEFMIEKQGKWDEYANFGLNSHSPASIGKYRRMLAAMDERLGGVHNDLDKDDLLYIIEMVR